MSTLEQNTLLKALEKCKPVFWIVFAFSFGVNLLMLITPLYSLQVLDRVLGSQNKETLLYLTLIMIVLYISLHMIQVARSFTLIKLGEWLDNNLSPDLFTNAIRRSALKIQSSGTQNLRDFQTVKQFLTSVGINTLFDAPWSVIYIIVLFIIHPWMGWLSVVGSILLFVFALFNAYATNPKLNEANDFSVRSMYQSDAATRNAEVVEAMGMMSAVTSRWQRFQQKSLELVTVASYRNGIISNISRFVRMLLQLLVTGLSAYLIVTSNEMTMGGMIASGIIMGRALAPFDNAIEIWKQISASLKAYERLSQDYAKNSDRQESMQLPTPDGRVNIENVYFSPGGAATGPGPISYVLKGVSFALEPGEVLAIIGPSAAGKSSLAKLLVGVWKPLQGNVRLDGADVFSWQREDFGKHVGYLPQDIELFSGSIKDNIARLQENADPAKIVEAAQLTGAHDLILRFPKGYETDIGIGGANLSGGQRQRIGLARAFYGDPKFVVLDEPNANLDELGEQALISAINRAKEKKITTIIISHRPSILSAVDKILILQDGSVAAFGTRDEIIAKISRPAPVPAA